MRTVLPHHGYNLSRFLSNLKPLCADTKAGNVSMVGSRWWTLIELATFCEFKIWLLQDYGDVHMYSSLYRFYCFSYPSPPLPTKVAPNGLLLTFLGGLEAVVSLRHLPSTREFTTDGYNPKKKYKARVLWTNASSKTMGLTLQKQIVAGLSFEFPNVEIGDIYQGSI